MEIYELRAEDAPTWAWSAAERVADTRRTCGCLSSGAASDLMRSIVSTFRVGVPQGMRVFCDSEGGWLWLEEIDDDIIHVRGGSFTDDTDLAQWEDFIRSDVGNKQISWRVWGVEDSLTRLVENLGAYAASVTLGASVSSIVSHAGSSGAWLRPMGAGELMRFQVASANEMGNALVKAHKNDSVDKARREAFHRNEAELSDGVASPGHRLYSLCHDGQTIGGAWLDIDSGVASIRSVVIDSESRGQGHRRSALSALAAAAHMEGARYIQTTVIPADHPFVSILRDMGMDVISTEYIQMPGKLGAPALQKV